MQEIPYYFIKKGFLHLKKNMLAKLDLLCIQ